MHTMWSDRGIKKHFKKFRITNKNKNLVLPAISNIYIGVRALLYIVRLKSKPNKFLLNILKEKISKLVLSFL